MSEKHRIKFDDLKKPVADLHELLGANASGANRMIPGALSDLIEVMFGHRDNVLINAAPDLIAALERILRWRDNDDVLLEDWDSAKGETFDEDVVIYAPARNTLAKAKA